MRKLRISKVRWWLQIYQLVRTKDQDSNSNLGPSDSMPKCPWLFTLVGLVTSCCCWSLVCLSPGGTDPDKLVLWMVSDGPAFSTNIFNLSVCFSWGYPFHQDPPMGCHPLNPYLVAHRAFVVPWWVFPSHFYRVRPWAGPAADGEACPQSSEADVCSVEMESRPPAGRGNTNQREPISSLNWTLLLFCLWDLEEFASLCWIIFQIYPPRS